MSTPPNMPTPPSAANGSQATTSSPRHFRRRSSEYSTTSTSPPRSPPLPPSSGGLATPRRSSTHQLPRVATLPVSAISRPTSTPTPPLTSITDGTASPRSVSSASNNRGYDSPRPPLHHRRTGGGGGGGGGGRSNSSTHHDLDSWSPPGDHASLSPPVAGGFGGETTTQQPLSSVIATNIFSKAELPTFSKHASVRDLGPVRISGVADANDTSFTAISNVTATASTNVTTTSSCSFQGTTSRSSRTTTTTTTTTTTAKSESIVIVSDACSDSNGMDNTPPKTRGCWSSSSSTCDAEQQPVAAISAPTNSSPKTIFELMMASKASPQRYQSMGAMPSAMSSRVDNSNKFSHRSGGGSGGVALPTAVDESPILPCLVDGGNAVTEHCNNTTVMNEHPLHFRENDHADDSGDFLFESTCSRDEDFNATISRKSRSSSSASSSFTGWGSTNDSCLTVSGKESSAVVLWRGRRDIHTATTTATTTANNSRRGSVGSNSTVHGREQDYHHHHTGSGGGGGGGGGVRAPDTNPLNTSRDPRGRRPKQPHPAVVKKPKRRTARPTGDLGQQMRTMSLPSFRQLRAVRGLEHRVAHRVDLTEE